MSYDLAYQIGSYMATGSSTYDNRDLIGSNTNNENIYASIRSLVNVGTNNQSSAVWCGYRWNIFRVSSYTFFLSFSVLFLFEKKKLSSFKSISWSKDVAFSRSWITCLDMTYGHANGLWTWIRTWTWSCEHVNIWTCEHITYYFYYNVTI